MGVRGRGGLVENKDYNHSFDLGGHIVPLAFTSCLCDLTQHYYCMVCVRVLPVWLLQLMGFSR